MTQHTHNLADPEGAPLVLYDGVCALCNWAVRFILDRDPVGVFRFARLQSDIGRQWQERFGLPVDALDTVILVQDRRAFVRSEAAFRILRQLRTGWKAVLIFQILPSFISDLLYRLVARWRYRVFGRYDSCPLPPSEARHRFLDLHG
ncbi:MAG: DCC1-like thiol-disulfide oxidoreductase family protein [Bacteroidetes bacterium]|nr:DCC1-like thiol-disulfide oxidoreductase family protein [Bacteroidota bacterium]